MQAIELQTENCEDTSEWKLCPTVFKQLCSHLGTPLDAFQQDWIYQFLYAFPPFSIIGRALRKLPKDKKNMIIVTPGLQSQSWYPILLKMKVRNSILLPKYRIICYIQNYNWFAEPIVVVNPVKDESPKSNSFDKLSNNLVNSEEKIHPLIQNSPLRLVEWLVSGKNYLQKEYQKGLWTLS